jgi:HSP20 family protein
MKAGKEITVPRSGTVERMPRAPLFGDVDRMFDQLFNRRWMHPFGLERPFAEMAPAPSVDIIDRDDDVIVRAEVPGYRKEDIDVSVSNGLLTIKGETKTEEKQEKGDYYRCEISHGGFARTLSLPASVDDSKAHAAMNDGVLELTLPKLEKGKRHTIAIS